MTRRIIRTTHIFGAIAALCLCSIQAYGHFPWLTIDQDGYGLYYFGETMAERNYKLPERIADAKIQAAKADRGLEPLAFSVIESDDFIGKRSTDRISSDSILFSQVTYGIHGGARLDYYTQHIGMMPNDFQAYPKLDGTMRLFGQAIRFEQGVKVRVFWNEKPLADAEVQLFGQDGLEAAKKKTNDAGEIVFSSTQVMAGLNAILVGHKVEEQGEFAGRAYQSASHYLTTTFRVPTSTADNPTNKTLVIPNLPVASKPNKSDASNTSSSRFAELPLELTSFGAVRASNTLYVYGGHTGEAHHYSTQEQSNRLFALDLSTPGASWQELSQGRRLQGLGLVTDGQRIIRVGGFEALNGLDEKHNLQSTDEVAAFDITSGTWSLLPSLPEPRSSHDAFVVQGKLYVAGGWSLRGEETDWLQTAWSLDLSKPVAQWEALPNPGFRRRAASMIALKNRLYMIGGMNEEGGPTTEVAYFDIDSRTWHSAPSLIGRAMNGFGASAWTVGEKIVVTTMDGDIQTLTAESSAWVKEGSVRDARFFHRLLPLTSRELIAIGGANMEQGKFRNVEVIRLP